MSTACDTDTQEGEGGSEVGGGPSAPPAVLRMKVSTYVRQDAHFFGQALGGVQAGGGGVGQSRRQGVHVLSQGEAGLPRLRDTPRRTRHR